MFSSFPHVTTNWICELINKEVTSGYLFLIKLEYSVKIFNSKFNHFLFYSSSRSNQSKEAFIDWARYDDSQDHFCELDGNKINYCNQIIFTLTFLYDMEIY